MTTARRWALDILERKKPWVNSYYKTDKLEPLGEAREILNFARAQTRKRAPNLMHPLLCIDSIEEGIVSGVRAGLWKVYFCSNTQFLELDFPEFVLRYLNIYICQEAQAFQVLLESDTCKSLVHIFFAQRGTAKVE